MNKIIKHIITLIIFSNQISFFVEKLNEPLKNKIGIIIEQIINIDGNPYSHHEREISKAIINLDDKKNEKEDFIKTINNEKFYRKCFFIYIIKCIYSNHEYKKNITNYRNKESFENNEELLKKFKSISSDYLGEIELGIEILKDNRYSKLYINGLNALTGALFENFPER